MRGIVEAPTKYLNKSVSNPNFMVDKYYKCFFVKNHGAWMGNIIDKEDFVSEYYQKYSARGYNLNIGPSSNRHSQHGVFCSNYKELLAKDMEIINKIDNLLSRPISLNSKKLAVRKILQQEIITNDSIVEYHLRKTLEVIDFDKKRNEFDVSVKAEPKIFVKR